MPIYDAAAVSDAVFVHGRGASVQQVRQLRDNPLAIAEASPGAPVVAACWHWFDQTNVDDGSEGLVYDHAVDGNVSIIESPAFEAGYDYEVQYNLDLTLSGDFEFRIQIQLASNNSWKTIYTREYNGLVGATGPVWGAYTLRRPMAGSDIIKTLSGAGSFAITSARNPDEGPISAFRVSVDGVFDGGTFRLMRRREYVS